MTSVCAPSRLMAATPYEILNFIGRGVSLARLPAPEGRARPASIDHGSDLDPPADRAADAPLLRRINEWKERADHRGRPTGLELIVPDWFYGAVLDDALILTIDRGYFGLTGGLERWLYRLVRKHGGRQEFGWSFDFRHLHSKSGSLSPLKHFAYDLRDIVRRQPLPGYRLTIGSASKAGNPVVRADRSGCPRHPAPPSPDQISPWG